MDFSLLKTLEETTAEASKGLSSNNRIIIAMTVGIIIVTAIAIYLLINNQRLAKKLKEIEEDKE